MGRELETLQTMCLVLDWRGGTLEQVCRALDACAGMSEEANAEEMEEARRKAQACRLNKGE